VHVDLKLPDSATLSLEHRFGEKYALLADASWTGWSSIQELRIVRDTVPLNQDAGNAAASALLVGEQHSDIDIVSAQCVYRF
jgi:long-subunit fatty acid transport protein